MMGIGQGMPARSWTMESVMQALSDEPLSVMTSRSEVFSGTSNQHTTITCSSSELLLQHDRHLYLAQHPLCGPQRDGNESSLYQDTPLPLLPPSIKDPEAKVTSVNLWLCLGSVRSSLHYDEEENLLCIIKGQKHITLYPPKCTAWLYPRSVADDGSVNHSMIELSLPEDAVHRSYPLYRLAQRHKKEITAQEGDGIFIPAGWWHQIDSVDNTIAVNYWWPATMVTVDDTMASCYFQLRKGFGACQSQMIQQWIEEKIESTIATNANDQVPTYEMLKHLLEKPWSQSQHPEALACFIFKLTSQELARILLHASQNHPHLIAAMFSHPDSKLTPLASFLLTSKLEALETETQGSDLIDLAHFYRLFYAASGTIKEPLSFMKS